MNKAIKVVRQTFTTNKYNDKTEATTERPTMGGKTISAISAPPTHTHMSSQELKLLSRRIDPHEPLSSPHASPKKPPLPNLSRKRPQNRQDEQARMKRVKTAYETTLNKRYVCEPCHKVYKTRNGLTYHKEKCKYQKYNETASKTIIRCICSYPTENKGTMIECTQCHTWLHSKCSGDVTNEESYCCPRCDTSPLLDTTCTSEINKQIEEVKQQQETDDGHSLYQERDILQSRNESEESTIQEQFDFINLFSDDLLDNSKDGFMMTLDSLSAVQEPLLDNDNNNQSLAEEDPSWVNEFSVDLNSSHDDTPSLLFSDNNPSSSSFLDDFSADIPSSPQADWLHLANFEVDFTPDFINF
ncbi:uncharacterized protein BX663DRAFT_513321 [Cokeromyces recurvatus]|uniref:uncharacterized protein n=1 Tax=Cokeromyces recurvatus TaxID=90255 RepID=UPI00221E77C6|nr:uncharacterized protein BX663DRAFT_513321 [Cokeromyces recurvatus]KAI7901570.1 hypothetical protein BX663DRAFT_513321 [Cokeromyces recurvatus]